MIPLFLLASILTLLPPWSSQIAGYDPAETRLPIILVAGPSPAVPGESGFDGGTAALHIVRGTADRLRARGISVENRDTDSVVVAPYSGYHPGESLRLSVAFPSGASPEGSGTETRFGGRTDEAWRLARRVHEHLLGGLSDVMGYDSYNRGIVEEGEASAFGHRPEGLQQGDHWVATYPLLATNLRERGILESPGTLDLLSAALADAVSNYLSPIALTPPRDPRHGWRLDASWKPVTPSLVVEAEGSNKVALTFDAGSYPPFQPTILDTLRDADVRCTMFLTGDFVDAHPEAVMQMVRDGHEIANHSDAHIDMPTMSNAEIAADLATFDSKIIALTGKSTRPWFRPPSGAYNDRVVEVAAQEGYYTIYWTEDSADWRSDVDAATVRQRLLRYSTPGSIMVAHLTSPQTAEVLPEVLQVLKGQGREFALVSEVIHPGE